MMTFVAHNAARGTQHGQSANTARALTADDTATALLYWSGRRTRRFARDRPVIVPLLWQRQSKPLGLIIDASTNTFPPARLQGMI